MYYFGRMGLDSVEMIIEVENSFGFTIKNEDAERVRTVGELYQLVLRNLTGMPNPRCKTQHLFYRLRNNLPFTGPAWSIPRPRKTLHPSLHLREFVIDDRAYGQLERDMAVPLPRLWLTWPAIALNWTLSACVLALLIWSFAENSLLLILCASALGWIAYRLADGVSKRCRRVVPNLTIREFIQSIASQHYDLIHPKTYNKAEVKDCLLTLIVEKLGVDRSELNDDARFVEDLGMD